MRAPTREWLARHSHAHGDFDAAQLAESLRAKGEQVTVVIPAKDEAATVGEVDEESRLLSERTHEAMMRGIRAVKPGRETNVIGRVIEMYAKRFGYGVVREYTGNGVHSAFHSGLVILHYDNEVYRDVMEPGMTFTIEPMLALGDPSSHVWDDDWTVVTNDLSRVAQWEHTVAVTEDGVEILTLPPEEFAA